MLSRNWLALPALVLLHSAACRGSNEQKGSAGEPAPDTIPAWLLARQSDQRVQAQGSAVLHDFRFADRLEASGITFRNQIVDDAGKNYKRVHYDHGTGIAAADVDGDQLVDLYFVSQRGTGELWKNQGGGRFLAWTDSAGLAMPDVIAVGASFADTDNDGDPDLYVTTVRHGNRFFENLGKGKYREITAAAGLGYVGHSSGAVFFDYDGDGRLDLFLTNVGVYTTSALGAGGFFVGLEDAFRGHLHPDRAEASALYRNLGGNRFRNVSVETGLVDRSWSGDATILDVNDDGRPDLYLPNMQGANHLWRNEGGRRFRDVTSSAFQSTPWGAMGVKSFDWNGDGRLDLLVTDMHSDMFVNIEPEDRAGEDRKADSARIPADFFAAGKTGLIFGNALFTNRGGGRFEDESDAAGAENYWPWGPSVGDLNADGWEDVFIASSMNFPHRYAVNAVLLNDSGRRFLRGEFLLGIEPRKGGVTEQPWFTLECAGGDRGNPFCRACLRPGATEPECRRRDAQDRLTMMGAVGTRSAVLADLDGDGDQDIVTNEFNGVPQVLLSDLADRHAVHALSIRLRGTTSNRQGIGARVTVVLPGGRRLVRAVDGKSGYLSQSDLPLYIGLGTAARADTVEVRWPSGKRQVLPGPHPSGPILEIVEP